MRIEPKPRCCGCNPLLVLHDNVATRAISRDVTESDGEVIVQTASRSE